MNAQLEHLIVLQAQDLELARLRSELAEAPQRVQRAAIALAATQRSVSGVRSALAEEDKLRRGQASEAASQRSKIDRLRRSLDAATSAAQVTAFEHEIHFAQSAVTRLEDEELASMERSETLEAQGKDAEAAATSAQNHVDAERTRAERVVSEAKAAIAGIEGQRSALRAGIDPDWLRTYDRLSKAKGSAVAEALGTATQGKCAACQMAVRPQRWQDLTGRDHEDQIFVCETCGRMLFWDPRRDTPRTWAAGDRLRNAQTGSPQ